MVDELRSALDTQEPGSTPAEAWTRLSAIFNEELELLRRRYNMIRGQHDVIVDKYLYYQHKFDVAIANRATTPMVVDDSEEIELTRISSAP